MRLLHCLRTVSVLTLCLLACGGAGPRRGPGPIPINQADPVIIPDIIESPTSAEKRAAWVAAGASGIGSLVVLECRVSGERLSNCSPFPGSQPLENQEIAALSLVELFRVSPTTREDGTNWLGLDNALLFGKPIDGHRVRVTVDFSFTGDPSGPRRPNPILEANDDVIWIARPGARVAASLAPQAAARAGVSGSATLFCRLTATGYLIDCSAEESRHGYGFGGAALELASFMRAKPLGKSGTPVEGRVVSIPFAFVAPG